MQITFIKINENEYKPATAEDQTKLNYYGNGEFVASDIKKNIPQRSLSQNGLFWACCTLVARNTEDLQFSTKNRVKTQCLLDQRMIEIYTEYIDRDTGEKLVHFELKSIAFENMEHFEACGFFDKAFEFMAKHLNISTDELIKEAQSRMGGGCDSL